MNAEFSEAWYKGIEEAKEKARKIIHHIIAINQVTNVIVGQLQAAEVDRLSPGHHPACKLTMVNIKKYSKSSDFQSSDDMGIFFVNKPDMILTMQELETKNPKVYEEVHINIKKGVWDGSKTNTE